VQPLPDPVRRLWRLIALAVATVLAGGGSVADVVARRVSDPPFPPIIVPLLIGVVVAGLGWALATLEYRSWRFELTDEWIQARWGVITRRSATIPRNRVQTLTSENGPIDRMLGLTSVTVHTAGAGAPNLSIPHLDDATVEWLRGELGRGPAD